MIRERETRGLPGLPVILVLVVAVAACLYGLVEGARAESLSRSLLFALALVVEFFLMLGVFVVNPNEGRVLQFFGDYVGTVRCRGCAGPIRSIRKSAFRSGCAISRAARLKVNDNEGNPIEIAAVVVWQVVDTAEAVFQVDDYNDYVKVQSEAALRNLATSYTV